MLKICAAKFREWGLTGFVIVQGILLVMLVMICAVHNLSYWTAVEYWIFQFVGIFLPGLAAVLLMKVNFENDILVFALSYALGIVILIIEYFLLMPAGLSKYALYAAVITGSAALFFCYKKRMSVKWGQDSRDWVICILFLILVLIVDFFVVSLVNTMPNETGGTGYYVDWLFWAGNNISFTKGFPVQNFRVVGEPFYYHYFSSIVVSQTNLITGIDLNILTFYFSPVLPAILLVFSGYVLFLSLLKRRGLRVLAMILLFFTGGTTVTYAEHIYICPFGFDYGYAYGMLAVMVLIYIIKREDFCIKEVFLSALLIAMTTGFKGPIGMVILMGFGVAAFVFLIRKHWRKGFIYGFIWFFSFVMVYFFFISGRGIGTSVERARLFVGLRDAFYQSQWMQDIFGSLTEKYDLPNKALILLTLWLYIYRADKAAVILLLTAVACCVGAGIKKKTDTVLLSLIAICIWGIFLVLTIIQSGSSQMYFLMAVIPFAVLAGLYAIENIPSVFVKFRAIMLVIVLGAACMGIYTWQKVILPKAKEGVMCVNQMLDKAFYSKYYVSGSDYEAYRWIRENTEEDAIVAVDYFYDEDEQPQEMAAGVFSERFVWNDGKYSKSKEVLSRRRVVEKFLEGSTQALQVMKKEGVVYFIQTLSVNPDFYMSLDDMECVFQNERFRVYKLS